MKRIYNIILSAFILVFCIMFAGENATFAQKWNKEIPNNLFAVPHAYQPNSGMPLTDMKVGIGTADPTSTLHVIGTVDIEGPINANTIHVSSLVTDEIITNRILSTDTVLRIGENTIYFPNDNTNRIYGDFNLSTSGFKGLGLGVAASAQGRFSTVIGNNVRCDVNAVNSVAIGAGGSGAGLLNNIPNSFMVGFHSNIPSLFVGQSSGFGTTSSVGIATTTPGSDYEQPSRLRLDVRGDARFGHPTNKYVRMGYNGANGIIDFFSDASDQLLFNYYSGKNVLFGHPTNGGDVFFSNKVNVGGQITSGPHTDYRLAVDGKIVSKEIHTTITGWADYVFDEDYDRMEIEEIQEYINDHGHLPNMKSEEEIVKNGLDLSEIARLQQEKIEELHLYVFELNEKLKEQSMLLAKLIGKRK